MFKKTCITILAIAVLYITALVFLVSPKKGEGMVSVGGEKSKETLTVWYWDDSLGEIFDAFAEENENIILDYVYVPNYEYAEQLRSAISFSEKLPDICMLQDKFAGDFLDLDIWENLKEKPYNLNIKDLPKGALDYITADNGTVVAVPYNLAASGLAYRSGMMEQIFGLSTSKEVDAAFPTWEVLIEKGAEYKESTNEQFYLFSSLGDVATVLYNQTEKPYVENEVLIEPERFLQYFKILHSLFDKGLVDNISQCSKKWYDDFESGKFLFAPWSMWLTQNKTFSKNELNDWKLTIPPTGSYKWGGTVCAIPSSSKHKEAAWSFIEFLALSDSGAEASKNASCNQFLYYKEDTADDEYKSLVLEGFGDFNVGEYYFDSLLKDMYTRELSPYDSAIDLAYHTTVKAISHDSSATPEQSYEYFLQLLQKSLPHIKVS